jgi:hypothetical protein
MRALAMAASLWALSQSAQRLRQLRIGTVAITAITITVADLVPGTVVRLTGPFKAAFVSRIAMVRGISMDLRWATTDAGVNILEAAAFGGLFFCATHHQRAAHAIGK